MLWQTTVCAEQPPSRHLGRSLSPALDSSAYWVMAGFVHRRLRSVGTSLDIRIRKA